MQANTNPPLSPLLRAFTFVEVLALLAAGFGLLALPELARAQWPWTPAPFNTRFLGAIYAAALLPIALMFFAGRWSPARVVLPMLLTFTAIVLIASLAHLDQFDLSRWSNWVWFPLYVLLPINAALHLWLYRRRPPADPIPTPRLWRAYLPALTAALGVYGAALLVTPEAVSAFWPWKIDAFHGQMYGAVFAAGAFGAWAISRAASRAEFAAVGLAHAAFGLLGVAGLLIVDALVHKIDWSAAGTWAWIAAFGLGGLGGLGMIVRARNMR